MFCWELGKFTWLYSSVAQEPEGPAETTDQTSGVALRCLFGGLLPLNSVERRHEASGEVDARMRFCRIVAEEGKCKGTEGAGERKAEVMDQRAGKRSEAPWGD